MQTLYYFIIIQNSNIVIHHVINKSILLNKCNNYFNKYIFSFYSLYKYIDYMNGFKINILLLFIILYILIQ